MNTIKNWQEIDKPKALSLLEQILLNVNNNVILHRNSEALEKRYGKPSGTVSDYIFHYELSKEEILEKLEKDDTIYL